ncbi:endoglucanase isoform X1 [Penaeus vannamei]|uniref:endoglucanase isoform X1 n=2 Tax=Penaeus vannamei TaxID=6689 RepID=UPI00387F6A11
MKLCYTLGGHELCVLQSRAKTDRSCFNLSYSSSHALRLLISMWASIIFASLVAVSSGIPQYSSPPPPSYIAPAPACDPVTVTETTTEYGEVVETTTVPVTTTNTLYETEVITQFETVVETDYVTETETNYQTETETQVIPTTIVDTQTTYQTVYETETQHTYITETTTAVQKQYKTVCPKNSYVSY